MKRFLLFLAVGTFFSTVEEYLTVRVLRNDKVSYIFTLALLFPVILTFVYWSSKLLDRLFDNEPARELAHIGVYGFLGLMFEWFLMNLSPWKLHAAGASLWYIVYFQLGMLSFWTTVTFAPRLFINPGNLHRKISKQVLWFYVPYFVAVYAVTFSTPPDKRFDLVIALILVGYVVVNGCFANYFRQARMRSATEHVRALEIAAAAKAV